MKINQSLATLLICCIINIISAHAQAKSLEYQTFHLKNGLEIVVVPKQNAKAVTHMLLFHAGAADDQLGASGVAHYLEHLLFKGTKQTEQGEYSRIIDQLGGEHNAFTTSDMTGYYVTIAAENLPKIMELEADRMQNYAPNDAVYAKEREVIIEERRMRTDNNPLALLDEAMNAAMFRHHPYGTPIIGWAHEMAKLDKQQAQIFFKKYYNPTNVTLLLVGDIDESKAQKLAQAHYGNWAAGKKQQHQWVVEPFRNAADLITMQHENVKQPKLVISYLAPSFNAAENHNIYALLLAEELLGNERTGFLYQKLVKEQHLASSINLAYYPFTLGQSMFSISATPNEGVELPKLQAAVLSAINHFMAQKIDEKALQRAKNQATAETIYAQDSQQGLSFFLAILHMSGTKIDWFNNYPTNLAKVSETEIIAELKQVIDNKHSVTGYLIPEN
jgi:zinc protease